MTITTFRTYYLIWGYVVSGVSDVSARVAEGWDDPAGSLDWDKTSDYLETVWINGERAAEPWALWWVKEHERRLGAVH